MDRGQLNKSIADQRFVCLDTQLKLADLVAEDHAHTIAGLTSIVKNIEENQKQVIALSERVNAVESGLDGVLRKLGGLIALLGSNHNTNQSVAQSTQLQLSRKSTNNASSLASVAGTDPKDSSPTEASLNVDTSSNFPHSAKPNQQMVGETVFVASGKDVQHKVNASKSVFASDVQRKVNASKSIFASDDDISAVLQKKPQNVVAEPKQEKVVEGVLSHIQQDGSALFDNVCVLVLDPKTKERRKIGVFRVKFARLSNVFELTFMEGAETYYFYLKHDEKIFLPDKLPDSLVFCCYWSEDATGTSDVLLLKFNDAADKQAAHAFISKDSH